MSHIKYIFRDFWGVVAKFKKDNIAYVDQMATAYKISKEQIITIVSEPMCKLGRGEITENQFRTIVSKKLGVATPRITRTIFHKAIDEYATRNKNIIRFVGKLQKLGYICIILSDDNTPQATLLRKSGWYTPFNYAIISCDIGISKYDDTVKGTTKIFDYMLKKYKIKSTEAIFVDDVKKNCIAAKQAGIMSVLAEKPSQVIDDLKKILHI